MRETIAVGIGIVLMALIAWYTTSPNENEKTIKMPTKGTELYFKLNCEETKDINYKHKDGSVMRTTVQVVKCDKEQSLE